MATDELVGLLVQVVQEPANAKARRRAAELLDQRGLTSEALAVVSGFINFTGHEDPSPLPCLCKTCVASAGLTAETEGVGFHRRFAVAGTRVLHFWLADELASQNVEVCRTVADALRRRLNARKRRAA